MLIKKETSGKSLKRKGKIFIDWMRNERGSTVIAPYSVCCARTGALVAVPIVWEELSRLKAANILDMKKTVIRLEGACPLRFVSVSSTEGSYKL